MRMLSSILTKSAVYLLLIVLSATAFAQKITVDPNIGVPSASADKEEADIRLAKRVTYEAWHTPVKTILKDISASSGVSILAGYNSADWQVRDRKMNVFVKDVTLAQLMNSIARVMKFKWYKKNTANGFMYRLCADRKLLAELQSEASRLNKKLKSEETKRREGLANALAEVADLSESDIQVLRDKNPYLYLCATTGFAKMMTSVFQNEPRLKEAFVSGNRTALVGANYFSASTQQLCIDNIRKMWPLDRIICNRNPVSDDVEQIFSKGEFHFSWLTNPDENAQRKRLFYYGAQLASDSTELHFLGDLRDPYAKSTQAWAKSCLDAVDQEASAGAGWAKLAPGYADAEAEDAKEIDDYLMFDKIVEHVDEPDLHKNVTLEVTKEEQEALIAQLKELGERSLPRLIYQAFLKAVARGAEMNVVSDSYAVMLAQGQPQLKEKDELISTLDTLTKHYRCNWEKHGSIIELRRLDWFRRRASQIPDEWIEPWQSELKEKSALSLNSYASIVVLSEDQIEENISVDPLLSQVIGQCWDYGDKRELCRLYLQLNDAQRKMLASDLGLDLRFLDQSQRQIYSDMFEYGWQRRWCDSEISNAASGKLTMKTSVSTNQDGSKSHKFTVYYKKEDGKSDEQNWTIYLVKLALKDNEKKTPEK